MAEPFLHEYSGSVRFWVEIDGKLVGASISRNALHYQFARDSVDEDPMATFRSHRVCIEDAVRRRVARHSVEPIMLRETDLQAPRPGRFGP